jgi:hypothetical protein
VAADAPLDRALDREERGHIAMDRTQDHFGRFAIAPLVPGTYWVYATDSDRNIVTEAVPVDVRAGETVDVVLPPKG